MAHLEAGRLNGCWLVESVAASKEEVVDYLQPPLDLAHLESVEANGMVWFHDAKRSRQPARSGMTGFGKSEMKLKAGMPWSVRFNEELGLAYSGLACLSGCGNSR